MKGLDEYGKGRKSGIMEMREVIQKEINSAIEAKGAAKGTGMSYKASHLSGVIKSGNKYLEILDKKLSRLKMNEIKG